VSHDLDTLTRLCRRGLWLEAGRIRESGSAADVVRNYLGSGLANPVSGGALLRSGPVTVRDVRVDAAGGPPGATLMRDDELRIRVDFELADEVPGLDLALAVSTSSGIKLFDEALSDHGFERLLPGAYCAELQVPPVLNVGEFTVSLWIGTMHEDLIHEPVAVSFTLGGSGLDRPDRLFALGLPFVVRPVTVIS
jgi:ABC-2 type transport system ATP-binding protein/lipopolysaccharide transport system ATP-binding protein